jgi:hypothetical protein
MNKKPLHLCACLSHVVEACTKDPPVNPEAHKKFSLETSRLTGDVFTDQVNRISTVDLLKRSQNVLLMKNRINAALIIMVTVFSGCIHKSEKMQNEASTQKPAVVTAGTVENVSSELSGGYLRTAFKEDLNKGLIDTLSRSYLLSETDLNDDGKMEIFVGLQGPYFCGSGGCTVLLLDNAGKLITRFTVTDYPIRTSGERTKEWKNLVLGSRGKYHLLKFNGSGYPSNPSVEPAISLNDAMYSTLVLDKGKEGTATFMF